MIIPKLPPFPLTEAELRYYYTEKGMSHVQIGKLCGRHPENVRRTLHKYGIAQRAIGRPPSNSQRAKAVEAAYEEQASLLVEDDSRVERMMRHVDRLAGVV